jgi:hypothetical protein
MQNGTKASVTCIVCGQDKDIRLSMRLSKDSNGQWKSNPCCHDCRGKLIRQAQSDGYFIPFYSWETSQKEVLKRNEELKFCQPFVSAFGRKREEKPRESRQKDRKRKPPRVANGSLMITG